MILTKVKPRQATLDDVPTIQRLLRDNDLLIEGLDWSEIDKSWWLVEHKNEPVGCFQVLIGKPLGFVSVVAVDPRFHNSGAGAVMFRMAEFLLCVSGCDGYVSIATNPVVLNRLDDFNTVDLGEVHFLVKRVPKIQPRIKDNVLPQTDNRHSNGSSRSSRIF